MKKCGDEIQIKDFEKNEESIPIWTPLTLLMK
jgi:hypothetical protein